MDWKTVTVSAVRSFMSRTPPSLLSEAKERMFTMRDSAPEPVKNPDKDVEKERFKPLDEIMINTNCPDSEPEPGKEPEPEDKTESVAGLNNPEPRAGVSVNESVPLPRPLPANSLKTEVAAGEKAKRKFPNNFTLPLVSMLKRHEDNKSVATGWIEESRHILQKTLESFKVDGTVTGIVSGPRVTRFEISLAPGVKVEKVSNITNNIAMELEAKSIRVLAPIPGKNAVGVEVPNAVASSVSLRSMMETRDWKNAGAEIPIILGKDVGGNPIVLDLAKAPHLLIAGATGSGKSVCMNTLIMSLLFKFTPSELRLILVDPKVVELEMYTPLPHLITPVVNDPQKVPLALRWAVNEMEKRYRMMAKVKAKNLAGFNSRPHEPEPVIDDWGNEVPAKLPILVVIVDELADVMMTDAKSDVETSIARIAQKGRAAGVHIVIATQRPSTNIITGVIKANLPTRIAFRVGAIVDSRVILDQKGAETLLGRGDMLFIPPGSANLERIQGAMVDDPDTQKVVEFVSSQADQQFDDKVVSDEPEDESSAPVAPDTVSTSVTSGVDPDIKAMVDKYSEPGDDDNILKSLEILFSDRKISTSYIQRRLGIGYNKAAEIMDAFEVRGLVSAPQPGGSKRDILVFDEIENS
jgi:S-DNA-T family DNA segregation ATPase FtsK/SpoIIIE